MWSYELLSTFFSVLVIISYHCNFCAQILDRLPEVVEIRDAFSLEIRGRINTLYLSRNTQYVAYLVSQMIDAQRFKNCLMRLSVGVYLGILEPCVKRWVVGDWLNYLLSFSWFYRFIELRCVLKEIVWWSAARHESCSESFLLPKAAQTTPDCLDKNNVPAFVYSHCCFPTTWILDLQSEVTLVVHIR